MSEKEKNPKLNEKAPDEKSEETKKESVKEPSDKKAEKAESVEAEKAEKAEKAENSEKPAEPSADEALEKLKAENAELRDKYLRLLAEFDNYRKRSAKERQEIYPEATANAAEAFLSLADNFERAALAECSDEKYKAGVMMIYDQLSIAFKKLGVEEIARVGEPFDPAIENAVNQITDENLGENTVAQVYQKGYRLGDKIIRPATVCVANA